jgi:signal peptide peptidase SppA
VDSTQRDQLLSRAAALLDLRPEELGFDAHWLEAAREAALHADVPRLQALNFGWGSAVREAEIEDGIGRIQIYGPLLQGFFTDYTDIREAFDTFMDDAGVHAVVLDIDSPGGQVHGALSELASAVRARRSEKPVVAIANEWATSAAYWIAAQAGEVVAVSQSAVLGSIGVIATHFDYSKMLEQDGIEVTEVVSGRLKNALSRYRPLSRDGRQLLAELVETAFRDFIEHVSAGRGLSEKVIRDLEGGILLGQAAVDADLADRIESLDDVRAGLIEEATRSALGPSADQEDTTMAKTEKPAGAATDKPAAAATDKPAGAATDKPAAAASDKPATDKPAAAGATVVDIEVARTEARAEGRKEAESEAAERSTAIRQQCELAGCLDRFAEFLGSDMDLEAIGKKILADRVEGAGGEIDGHHADAGADREPTIDTGAVYKRWNSAEAFAAGKTAN